MVKSINIFNKGSILPSILKIEAELIEQENKIKKRADEKLRQAELSSAKLVEDTQKELPIVEEEERGKLLQSLNSEIENLTSKDEQEFQKLERCIEKNRKKSLEFILKNIIPQWNNKYIE